MKKILSALICLCLVLTSVGAVAEEVSQAVLAQAFKAKVQNLMQNIPGENAITFTLTGEESSAMLPGPVTATLQHSGETQQDQLVSLQLQLPGSEEPIEVQLGAEAAWLKAGGQVFQVNYADLKGMVQVLLSTFSAIQIDPQIASELAQLLLMYTVLPGIQVESEDNETRIQVTLNAKDVISGAVAFGDQVLSTPRYWEALAPLMRYIGTRIKYEGDLSADLPQQWPGLKENLLAVETDAALTAHLIIRSLAEEQTTLVAGQMDITAQGSTLSLLLSSTDTAKELKLNLTLSAKAGEMSLEMAALKLSYDKQARNLIAGLQLPDDQRLDLTATFLGTSLQAHLAFRQGAKAVLMMDVESIAAGNTVTSNAVLTAGNETVASSLYFSPYHASFSVSSQGQSLAFDAHWDPQGNFTASLTAPNSQWALQAEGSITRTSAHVTGSYTYRGRQMGTGEITAAKNDGQFTLTFTVNTAMNRACCAGQLYWSPAAKRFSCQAGDTLFAVNVLQDAAGKITLAKLESGSGSGDWEMTYTPEALTYRDDSQTVTVTKEYLSETEHQVHFLVTARNQPEPQHGYIRTKLTEGENTWQIETAVENAQGERVLICQLACVPGEGFAKLSEQNPYVITAEDLQAILAQLMQNQAN